MIQPKVGIFEEPSFQEVLNMLFQRLEIPLVCSSLSQPPSRVLQILTQLVHCVLGSIPTASPVISDQAVVQNSGLCCIGRTLLESLGSASRTKSDSYLNSLGLRVPATQAPPGQDFCLFILLCFILMEKGSPQKREDPFAV